MRFLLSGTFFLYFLIVFYLAWEANQIFLTKSYNFLVVGIVIIAGISFPLYWILNLFVGIELPEILGTISTYIAPAFLYLTIYALIARALSLVFSNHLPFSHEQTAALILFLVALTLGVGNYLATNTIIQRTDLDLTNGRTATKQAKAVIFSDTHAGNSYHSEDLQRLSALINKENPDFVLAVGDIIDSPAHTAIAAGLHEDFKKIKAPVYAVVGNHEYINGGASCVKFLKECGFTVLLDEGMEIQPGLYVYGRRDVAASRFGYSSTEKELIFPQEGTTIVLDHTPSRTKEAALAGADLIVGGHTHNGQLFPLNFITKALFPVSCGLGKVDNATILVSSGFGLWGPRIRTTAQSEIWVVNITY